MPSFGLKGNVYITTKQRSASRCPDPSRLPGIHSPVYTVVSTKYSGQRKTLLLVMYALPFKPNEGMGDIQNPGLPPWRVMEDNCILLERR